MSSNSDLSTPALYSSGPDNALGVFLTIASILGVVFNLLSCAYFKHLNPKNANSAFFKKLYMSITLTDVAICVALFPAIDAAFSPNREGILESNTPVCVGSFTAWWLLSQTSVILVATLSLSRLLLLKNPNRVFRPNVAFLIPTLTFSTFLVLFAGAVGSGAIHVFYNANYIDCTFNSYSMDNDTQEVSVQDQIGAIVAMSLYNSVSSTVFNIVTVSFVLSLITLRKSEQAAVRVGGKSNKQREAAKTVVIVTLLYIICNLPFMSVMTYVLVDVLRDPATTGTTVLDIRKRYFTEIFGANHVVLNQYTCLIANKVFVSLNSLLNPVVYYFRIDGFKRFVTRIFKRGDVNPANITTETSGQV